MNHRSKRHVVSLVVALVLLTGCTGMSPDRAAETRGDFRLRIFSLQGEWKMVKHNVQTGETWHSVGQAWRAIQDDSPLEPSVYDIEVAEQQGGWNIARIDSVSGRVWYAKGNVWVPMEHED
jgi:outer membrane biogenesis lipoprotein LolB